MQARSDVLYGLSGTLWPVHLKPQPDELLSSWIVRLSHAHGYKVQTMCSLLFGRNCTIWNRDIDRSAPPEIGEILVSVTGATIDQFEGTTLRAYEGWLFERHNPNGLTRWLVPLGIFHRARKRPGLMFCPHCLNEDAEPYFRRSWRLALSIVCAKHECYLQDACPKCQSPLAFHRADMQGRQHYPRTGLNVHCWKCDFDLRESPQADDRPDEALVRFQVQLDTVLRHGYADWAGNPSMHSLVFFDGLRALVAGVLSLQTRERLNGPAKIQGIALSGWPKMGLEMASLPMRYEMFRWLAVLLENWPANFIDLIRKNKLRYADLRGDSACRPFWYEEVIRRECGGGYAPISDEEAEAIANAVELRHGRYSGSIARELYGRDIDAHVPGLRRRPVSDEVYEQLLVSIDHQIAGTQDEVKRYCLIRDKIMFATGRVLGLSESELAALTMERLFQLVPQSGRLGFTEMAKTPEMVRAWVGWYWSNIRPKLHPKPYIDCVFTSMKTRKNYRHSAISKEFQRAVATAMLGRSIGSYRCWVDHR